MTVGIGRIPCLSKRICGDFRESLAPYRLFAIVVLLLDEDQLLAVPLQSDVSEGPLYIAHIGESVIALHAMKTFSVAVPPKDAQEKYVVT